MTNHHEGCHGPSPRPVSATSHHQDHHCWPSRMVLTQAAIKVVASVGGCLEQRRALSVTVGYPRSSADADRPRRRARVAPTTQHADGRRRQSVIGPRRSPTSCKPPTDNALTLRERRWLLARSDDGRRPTCAALLLLLLLESSEETRSRNQENSPSLERGQFSRDF